MMTDEKLFQLCKKYGMEAKFWRQKFTGLLPEVNRRKLYERKGFSSIFEFAAKLGGLSAEQVRLALNLEKRFEDKPVLQKMLMEGEVSMNKLARVVSIATPENEQALAAQIKLLPQRALETLVRDEKILAKESSQNMLNTSPNSEIRNGLQISFFDDESLRVQTLGGDIAQSEAIYDKIPQSDPENGTSVVTLLKFHLDDDVAQELNDLNEKGINISEFLREILQERKAEIEQKKEEIAANLKLSTAVETSSSKPSRYIPVKIRKIIKLEQGTKCSIATCKKQSATIHHTQRFALASTHNPKYLALLCPEHHTIAHSIDQNYQGQVMKKR